MTDIKEREYELKGLINMHKDSEIAGYFKELLILKRERFRNLLEREENPEARGKAQECRDLIELLD